MEEKYNVSLTKDQVLMLQKLVVNNSYDEPHYEWEQGILENLETKLRALYEKPVMEQEEFERRIKTVEALFKEESEMLKRHAIEAERYE